MAINKICIVGLGVVGSQVKKWFEGFPQYTVFGFDPNKQSDSWDTCKEADCFFIAVPTPYKEDSEYDLSYLEDAVSKIPDGKIVIIKSTVNPGTTDYFQDKYPDKIFLFNPEFLTELNAEKDFVEPDMQILGVGYKGYDLASKIMLMLPPSPVMRIVSIIDAEWIKKIRNAFYSVKVIFFNEIYDIMQYTPSADYETIRSVIVEDSSIGNSHSFIFHKGYRGFGGKCLTKDTYSLIDFAKRFQYNPKLLSSAQEVNKTLNVDNV